MDFFADTTQQGVESSTTYESSMPNSSMISVLLASLCSVGTAAALALSGFYLHRREYVSEEGKKAMARYSQQVALPALFFSKMVACPEVKSVTSLEQPICPSIWENITSSHAGVLLIWPFFVVSMGLLVGKLVCRLSHTPKDKEHSYIAAVAFANSTGLVTTLLTVLQEHASLSLAHGSPQTVSMDPNSLLSLYLVFYPMLQWSFGGWILSSEKSNSQTQYQMVPISSKPEIEDCSIPTADCEDDGEQRFHDTEALVPEAHTPVARLQPMQRIINALKMTIFEQPPVCGALLGILVSLFPALRNIWVSASLSPSTSNAVRDAPLGWLFDAIVALGKSAIPINMAVLGANLSITMGCKKNMEKRKTINSSSIAAVVIGKLAVMPLVGFACVYIVEQIFEALSTSPLPPSMMLVMMMVFLTPTANTVMIMVDLVDGQKEEMARLLAFQYMFAPFLLSCSVAIAVKQSHFLL